MVCKYEVFYPELHISLFIEYANAERENREFSDQNFYFLIRALYKYINNSGVIYINQHNPYSMFCAYKTLYNNAKEKQLFLPLMLASYMIYAMRIGNPINRHLQQIKYIRNKSTQNNVV